MLDLASKSKSHILILISNPNKNLNMPHRHEDIMWLKNSKGIFQGQLN